MKVFVKTLKGTNFEIEVKPEDTVTEVKQIIETAQGADVYPAPLQMLIHKGKVLKDSTTLEENKVAENSFIVIMLSKKKVTPSGVATTSVSPSNVAQPARSLPASLQPVTVSTEPASTVQLPQSVPDTTPLSAPATVPASDAASLDADVYGNAASNLVAESNLESTIQQILDMGGGSWDRDTVVRALRAAFNNPERAVEYLYSGIPGQAVVPPVVQAPVGGDAVNPPSQAPQPAVPSSGPNGNPLDLFPQGLPNMGSNPSVGNLDFLRNSQQGAQAPVGGDAVNPMSQAPQPAVPSSGPNANPLDLFPQGLPNMGSNPSVGNLDFLRNSQQFQALRAMVQANPHILQPMLQELGKQNPNLMRLIQEHQGDFVSLINEPVEGEGNILGQLGGAVPQAVTVTPEEREAIERLEAMGFDRPTVLQVYFACNKNEELAANYLLDHMNEFDD